VTVAAADGQPPRPDGFDPEPCGEQEAPRAGRVLLWYPRSWRIRYGEEFAELLAAELAEQGPSWRRTVNVAATGLRARPLGGPDRPSDRVGGGRPRGPGDGRVRRTWFSRAGRCGRSWRLACSGR
jgi:hypothetical protein